MLNSDPLVTIGIHENKIRALYNDAVHFTGNSPVFEEPLYLLAFSNRSGSNLLAHYMRSVPYFGGFHEQLNHPTVKTQAAAGECASFPDYIRFASTTFGKDFKTWGFKASWDQIMMLYRFGIDRMYPCVRIIHIKRRDLVKQAVSYMIAHQTKKWTSKQKGTPDISPTYDYSLLDRLMRQSAFAEQQVRAISALFDLPYLEVWYETLVQKPERVMNDIGRFADIDLSAWQPQTPAIEMQADATNKAFYDRYIEERKQIILYK